MSSKYIPNSFQMANAIIDDFLDVMSPLAFKCYALIVRKTRGWQKESDSIAQSQFMKRCNIKKAETVQAVLDELLELGLIGKIQHAGKPCEFFLIDEPTPPNRGTPKNGDTPLDVGTPTPPNRGTPPPRNGVHINTKKHKENNNPLPPSVADETHDCANALVAADATTPDVDFENLADPKAKKPQSSLKKQQTEKRFTALANLFNQVFAGSNVQTVSLEATKTNASRKRLIPAAWEFAKRRVLTWCDADGLIDGEKPSSKHVLQWFEAYFAQCLADPFINGTSPRSKGHENWKPDFSYLLKATTLEKRILESQP